MNNSYDLQSSSYAEFADQRFAWKYIEMPAYDKYIPDLLVPEIRALDIGCGTGTVSRFLLSRGIKNIIGIDISSEQLHYARKMTPGITFINASAEEFMLPQDSIDLAITNTVLHHLDNDQLAQMLDRIYDVLSEEGVYFFVDVDPEHDAIGRDPSNTNTWTMVKTPWETEVPFFNRNPYDLTDLLDKAGFEKQSGWRLPVDPQGITDPDNYYRYIGRPSRIAARYKKVPFNTKILRKHDVRIPDLIETNEQKIQRKLVEDYFTAWKTQSIDIIMKIFDKDAIYDEKPGEEEPIVGLDAICEYWRYNPLSQENIRLEYDIAGYNDSIWSEFTGSFDVRGKHVDISGVIQFTVDIHSRKITRLTEYFKTSFDQYAI